MHRAGVMKESGTATDGKIKKPHMPFGGRVLRKVFGPRRGAKELLARDGWGVCCV